MTNDDARDNKSFERRLPNGLPVIDIRPRRARSRRPATNAPVEAIRRTRRVALQETRSASSKTRLVVATALALCLPCAGAIAQGAIPTAASNPTTRDESDPLDSGRTNALEIDVPHAPPRVTDDAGRNELGPEMPARRLDAIRNQRLEDSTQRFRSRLPSRQGDGSLDSRADRRLNDAKTFRPIRPASDPSIPRRR